MNSDHTVGKQGEAVAAAYLQRCGYVILEQSYRCPVGEIDIVVLDNDELVFVEVKTRTSLRFGYPHQAVDYKKQQRYYRISAFYRASHLQYADLNCRFDIIEVYIPRCGQQSINHIKNAFGVNDDRYY